jgi:hypothetical protein
MIQKYGSILRHLNSNNLLYALWNLPDDDLSKGRNMYHIPAYNKRARDTTTSILSPP